MNPETPLLCPCGNPRRAGGTNCLKCHAAATKKYRAAKPPTKEQRLNANARSYLREYRRRGLVKKGPCENCGTTENVEAVIADYSKPLDVRWLCRGHHRAEKNARRAVARAEKKAAYQEDFARRKAEHESRKPLTREELFKDRNSESSKSSESGVSSPP